MACWSLLVPVILCLRLNVLGRIFCGCGSMTAWYYVAAAVLNQVFYTVHIRESRAVFPVRVLLGVTRPTSLGQSSAVFQVFSTADLQDWCGSILLLFGIKIAWSSFRNPNTTNVLRERVRLIAGDLQNEMHDKNQKGKLLPKFMKDSEL